MLWHKYPSIKFLFPFIGGILLYEVFQWKISRTESLLLLFGFFFLALMSHIFCKRAIYFTFFLLMFFALLAIARYSWKVDQSTFSNQLPERVMVLAEIDKPIKSSGRYHRYFASIQIKKNDKLHSIGKILLNVDTTEAVLLPSDKIVGNARIYPLQDPPNPAQFNYSKYLSRKGIYHQAYMYSYRFVNSSTTLYRWFYLQREVLMKGFKATRIEGEHLLVLKAILLGDKRDLTFETKSSFALSGAMHILAVSGLHVGIIYLIFSQLFKTIGRKKYLILKSIFLLGILWSFALITGMSASVQRSSLMFSLMILAEPFRRKNNSINAVAISALIILILDPQTLFDPAFQLSYAAVLGILILYPVLFQLLKTKKHWMNKILSLMIISLSAQLATLPFSLWYFHLFPTYFLLTNLLVIPLAFAIVFLGTLSSFLFLLFKEFFFLDWILNYLIEILQLIVDLIASLPKAGIAPIWITPFSMFSLILFLVVLFYFLHSKRASYFIVSMFLLLIITISESVSSYQSGKAKEFTIYSFQELNAIGIRYRGKARLLLVDTLSSFEEKIIREHFHSEELKVTEYDSTILKTLSSHSSQNFAIQMGTQRVLLFNDSSRFKIDHQDLLIYRGRSLSQSHRELVQEHKNFIISNVEQSAATMHDIRRSAYSSSF